MAELTYERLKEVLSYDCESGEFTWKKNIGSRAKQGAKAGRIWRGQYRRISIDGTEHQAHRLAWLYAYGEWPVGEVDHINRQKADNRLINLRCVGRSGNQQNKGTPANNTSGVKGVHWHKRDQVWVAAITVNNNKKRLGNFKSLSAAEDAYNAAKRQLHVA